MALSCERIYSFAHAHGLLALGRICGILTSFGLGLVSLSSADVAAFVATEINKYCYEPPVPGVNVGVPWPADKVAAHVELLKQSLVPPRLESFVLAETYEQISSQVSDSAEYWVVAESSGYIEWYDPTTNEFGLAEPSSDGRRLISIGVRGDLIGGVLCNVSFSSVWRLC